MSEGRKFGKELVGTLQGSTGTVSCLEIPQNRSNVFKIYSLYCINSDYENRILSTNSERLIFQQSGAGEDSKRARKPDDAAGPVVGGFFESGWIAGRTAGSGDPVQGLR